MTWILRTLKLIIKKVGPEDQANRYFHFMMKTSSQTAGTIIHLTGWHQKELKP